MRLLCTHLCVISTYLQSTYLCDHHTDLRNNITYLQSYMNTSMCEKCTPIKCFHLFSKLTHIQTGLCYIYAVHLCLNILVHAHICTYTKLLRFHLQTCRVTSMLSFAHLCALVASLLLF